MRHDQLLRMLTFLRGEGVLYLYGLGAKGSFSDILHIPE